MPKGPIQRYIPYEGFLAHEYKMALKTEANVITNSKHMQQVLKQMFGVASRVIYPPVKVPSKSVQHRRGSYYITVSRLDNTKEIALLIHACNTLRVPLKIVGIGNDEQYVQYLHTIAGNTVEFLGFRSDTEIQQLYIDAIAFLFSPHNEDFGIAPVEAMAHGVPVIAYYGGGAKETVIEGKTGTFFYNHTPESLVDTIRKFSPGKYNSKVLYSESRKFSEERFHREIKHLVKSFF